MELREKTRMMACNIIEENREESKRMGHVQQKEANYEKCVGV